MNDIFVNVREGTLDASGVLLIRKERDIPLFYVHPDEMGRGIGSGLLDAALKVLSPGQLYAHASLNSVNWYLLRDFRVEGDPQIVDNVLADIRVCWREC